MNVIDLTRAAGERKRFASQVESEGGKRVYSCYQCGKCSAGCPLSFAMDYQPMQIMRMVQLGLKDEVLHSSTIWLCASCQTCTTRCPREVDIAGVMEALRIIALKERHPIKEAAIASFHEIFLETVRRNGRLHELGLMGRYKIASGDVFRDMTLGSRMLLQGKLKLTPHRITGAAEVGKMFERIKQMEEAEA